MARGLCAFFLGVTVALTLTGCAEQKERADIRRGLLTLDLSQDAFLGVWGRPTHTVAMSGDEIIKAGVTGWGFFFKRREMYEKWDYEARHTELIFYSHNLVAWRTSETVQQLAAPSTDDNPVQPIFPKY